MTSRTKILLAVGVAALLVVGGGLWWYLSDDNPDEVSLDAATDSLTSTTQEGDTGSTTSDDAGTDDGTSDLTGTWVVDTETGEFDFTSATGSFAGFRISEELVSVGATEAVGRTGEVDGTLTFDGTTLTAADITVGLTRITTDETRRDKRVQQALETQTFPEATFTLTEPIDLGADAAAGGAESVTATGELTVHGVTQQVGFPLEAQLVDGTIVVVGSLDISLDDYGVEAPSAPVVVSVSDTATVELQLLFVRQ